MPGSPLLTATSPAAGIGYGLPGYPYQAGYGVPSQGYSHGSFVVWLIVYALLATMILGGLKVGGFSFVFRTR